MREVILPGVSGSRRWPITKVAFKPRMPVLDKPMIYYILSMPVGARIRETLFNTTPANQPRLPLLGEAVSSAYSSATPSNRRPGCPRELCAAYSVPRRA
jgi:glucose-1-phosphate thymidylyltransferase